MPVLDDQFPERLRVKLKAKDYSDEQAHGITQAVAESLAEDSKLTALVENKRMDRGR